jgi:hypothetical protein
MAKVALQIEETTKVMLLPPIFPAERTFSNELTLVCFLIDRGNKSPDIQDTFLEEART